MKEFRCVRSALWTGTVRPGLEERFAAGINDTMIPILRSLPGVQEAWAMWPVLRQDNPPELACQVIITFEQREDLARMLSSAGRALMRPAVRELQAMFDGTLSHIEFDL